MIIIRDLNTFGIFCLEKNGKIWNKNNLISVRELTRSSIPFRVTEANGITSRNVLERHEGDIVRPIRIPADKSDIASL